MPKGPGRPGSDLGAEIPYITILTGQLDVLIGPATTLKNGVAEPPFVGTIMGDSGFTSCRSSPSIVDGFPDMAATSWTFPKRLNCKGMQANQPIIKWARTSRLRVRSSIST